MAPVSTGPERPKMTLDKVQQGIKILKHPPDGSRPELDIVFVPGLGTDPEKSWESDSTKFNWITDQKEGLARDFPKARLMLYQYESAWKGDLKVSQYMRNIANTMLVDLHDRREGYVNLPIVFIGHSMGGLVVAKAVTVADSSRDRFPTMSECISGCLFFGTPFHGTPAASVASMLTIFGEKLDKTTSSKLLDLMKPDDESLRELRTDFIRLVGKLTPKTELFCYYEEQPTNFAQEVGLPGVFGGAIPRKITEFVSRDSATMNGTIDEMGLASNHRNLVKFDGPKDSRYQLMRAPLKRIIHTSSLLVKSRINATRNIDRGTVLEVKKALEGPDGQFLRRKLDPKHNLSSWLKDAQEYKDWVSESSQDTRRTDIVWIRGHSGRGKTTNTISVLNDLERRIAELPENSSREVQPIVVYFFCENNTDRFTAEDVLKSFLLQIIEQQEALASYAKHFAKKKKTKDETRENTRSSLQPTIENLWQTIQDMLYDPFVRNTVYFVINNLHYLPEAAPSTLKLLGYIGAEVKTMTSPDQRRVHVRWLISSRSVDNIDDILEEPHVRLVDLEDEKYEDQVQKELRKHAFTKVSALRQEKNYDRDVAYFAHSLIGKRAQNTQWIDITYLHLKALTGDDSRLKVRQILDKMPQDVDTLLENAWHQVFRQNINVVEQIKEMLRALVLTFEDPSVPELCILAGILPSTEGQDELRDLVEKCKPLLTTQSEEDSEEITIGFTDIIVKTHLLQTSKALLGLSEDETKWQHGMLAFRSFEHLTERFAAVLMPESDNNQEEADEQDAEPEGDAEVALSVAEDQGEGQPENTETVNSEGENDTADTADDKEGDEVDGEGAEDGEKDEGEDEDNEENEEADDDEEAALDPEEEAVKDAAMTYMVKYWLRHAGYATKEIAEDLTATSDSDFWTRDSLIRRRWLIEFARLDGRLSGWPVRSMSALHVAAAVGFPDLVDALIKDGHQSEMNDIDDWDNTPLHLAAHFDQVDVVDVLLKAGAEIDHGKEKAVQTPLHMASFKGYVKVMRKLVARGADINAFANDAGPVLNAAIGSGDREAVELLIDQGADLTIEKKEDVDIPPPLAAAALNSDTTIFDFLVSKCATRLPSRDYDQALLHAARAGQAEVFDKLLAYDHSQETYQAAMEAAAREGEWGIVKTILEKRAGLNCHETFIKAAVVLEDQSQILRAVWQHTNKALPIETINQALYEAVDCENANIVKILLDEFGADPSAEAPETWIGYSDEGEGNYGNTLTAAAADGTIDIVKMLIDKGADINSPAGWALQAATFGGHTAVVQELIDRGANIDHMTTNENYSGGTALQKACQWGKTEIMHLLFDHGADPNLGGGEWTCPLIAAAGNREEEITKILLEKGASVNVYGGKYHSTPLMLAAAWLSLEPVRLILEAGADINAFDNDGDTALILAARSGDSEVVKFLLENGADVMHANDDGQNALLGAVQSESFACISILAAAVSRILASVKTIIDAGDESLGKTVRDAGVLQKEAETTEHVDVGEPEDEESPPENVKRAYTSGLEVYEPGTPSDTTPQQITQQPIGMTSSESQPSGQHWQSQGDYSVDTPSVASQSTIVPSPLPARTEQTEPSQATTILPYRPNEAYPTQPPENQPAYQPAYPPNVPYQHYNTGPPVPSQNYPTYNTHPPSHQPYNPAYDTSSYQHYNSQPVPNYGQPPVAPGYQSYNHNPTTYDGSSYGSQDQQQPSRPELSERTSSSSLFGMGKDTFDRAKQFGMNRWR